MSVGWTGSRDTRSRYQVTADNSADISYLGSEDQKKVKRRDANTRLTIARIQDADRRNPYIFHFDTMTRNHARQIAGRRGINYDLLRVRDKLLLTGFHCLLCGPLPFYYLDLRNLNRVRCGRCSSLVVLRNSGKYGRIRKKIAISACRAIDESLGYGMNPALPQP